MVNMTISLPEDTVKRLRRTVKERYSGRKGAISGLIRDALEERIRSAETQRPPAQFRAYQGDSMVAEATTLDQLASQLGQRGIDPRSVRIVSTTPIRRVTRAGLPRRRS